MSNRIDPQYKELLEHILHFGVEKKDRTGTGTKSVFGWQIKHKMKYGFPLLTTKKMAWKTMVTELLWFLRGDTNIKYLVDNDCMIWVGDAYKKYEKKTSQLESFVVKSIVGNRTEVHELLKNNSTILTKEEFINKIKTDDEFAKTWGELGPVYGKQWRSWTGDDLLAGSLYIDGRSYPKQIDQIQNLINELKTNPDSRRLMVNAWNVGELDQMVLPPCHYGFQVYTRELRLIERIDIAIEKGLTTKTAHLSEEDYWKWCDKRNIPTRAISLMWNQRSVDTFLGLPFNIASYGLLLEIIAKEVNMVPDELIGNLGDCHLYLNHIEQAKEQITRTPFELPKLKINDLRSDTNSIISDTTKWSYNDFQIEDYQSHPSIKAPLSN